MKPVFFSAPIMLPRPNPHSSKEIQSGMSQFCRRAAELWRAAALIDASEPGLLTPPDRDAARRRGVAAGRRVLYDCPKGKACIAYLRALTGNGFETHIGSIPELADRIWILEDRCSLADSYLRAISDAALQHGAECILCPSPLHQNRLEAVILPGCKAAFLSEWAINNTDEVNAHRVHLDRIPTSERKQALKDILKDNRKMTRILIQRASECLRNAEILRDLKADTCAVQVQRL